MRFSTSVPAPALAAWRGFAMLTGAVACGAMAGAQALPPAGDPEVRAVEVIGSGQIPSRPLAAPGLPARGDIAFNLPATDVQIVAKAVLGDVLHVPFAVAPGTTGLVTAVTPYPIARAAVLPFLEEVLRASHLALVRQNGTYTILAADQARGGPAGEDDGVGFSTDIVHLQYVGAAELKALLDPVLPGVVASIDAAANTITLSGTSGQRANARDILREFDVNWLRRMSFALYIPQRSDSRLIVPELDKLLNAPDAPTRSMVRLIAMEKLNGILAVTAQPQYLTDVKRWIEVLDREGENNEEQLFVYRVQNGRSKDLVKTLNQAFGTGGGSADGTSDQANGASTSNGFSTGNGASTGNGPTGTAPPLPPGSQNARPNPSQSGAPSGARRLEATISSDENNNAVVIFGTPHDYGIVLAALRKLDLPPYQVMIEAAIAEVTLTDDTRFGLQWQFNQSNVGGAQTQSSALDLTKNGVANLLQQTPGFSVLFVHGTALSAVLNTLQTHSKVNVVSAPKLMVLNNQTAALQVGDEVPILTQMVTSQITSTPSTTNSVDYKDTGVILKITPRVNEGGLVMLDLSQEVSSVVNNTSSNISSPTISTRKIATTVAVQDGEVLALGGMIQNSVTRDKNGIPILSQIPIIGALFGNHENVKARTELIVLLKPHVIRTIDDGRAVTEELRNALAGTQLMVPAHGIP